MRKPNPQVRPAAALAAWDLEGLARDACGGEVADWLRIARSPAFGAA